MTLTGSSGKLRVGYQDAAILSRWTVTSQHQTLGSPTTVLHGIVARLNQYWVEQRPIVVGLWMGQTWWVWESADVVVDKGIVNARLIGSPVAQLHF